MLFSRLYGDLINESLTEIVYDADLAGLRYGLNAHEHGMVLVLHGYNDKLHILARRLLEKIKNITISADKLAIIKEQVQFRSWLWHSFHNKDRINLATGDIVVAKFPPEPIIPNIELLRTIFTGRRAMDL